MKEHEKFNNICGGIQSLVIAIAIIIGGIWSAYTFGALSSTEKARAELEALQKNLKGTPSLDITLEVSQVSGISPDSTGVIVLVKVQNKGSKHILLDLDKKPLQVSKIVLEQNGNMHPTDIQTPNIYTGIEDGSYIVMATQTVQVNSTKVLAYYFEVHSTGVYKISFRAPVPESLIGEVEQDYQKQLNELSITSDGSQVRRQFHWSASTFVPIKVPNSKVDAIK